MKTNVFETGISDHHRESPKTKYYRDYRKFDIDYFSSELSRQLNSVFCSIKKNVDYEELNEFSRLHRVFLNLFNIQAPLKKKILRDNNSPFISKTLRKAKLVTLQNTKKLKDEIVKKD